MANFHIQALAWRAMKIGAKVGLTGKRLAACGVVCMMMVAGCGGQSGKAQPTSLLEGNAAADLVNAQFAGKEVKGIGVRADTIGVTLADGSAYSYSLQQRKWLTQGEGPSSTGTWKVESFDFSKIPGAIAGAGKCADPSMRITKPAVSPQIAVTCAGSSTPTYFTHNLIEIGSLDVTKADDFDIALRDLLENVSGELLLLNLKASQEGSYLELTFTSPAGNVGIKRLFTIDSADPITLTKPEPLDPSTESFDPARVTGKKVLAALAKGASELGTQVPTQYSASIGLEANGHVVANFTYAGSGLDKYVTVPLD